MPDDDSAPAEADAERSATPETPEEPEKADKADKADEAGNGDDAHRRRVLVQVVVVLVALGLFAWSLIAFIGAVREPDYAADARVRDEVLVEADHAVEVLNTLDYRDVDTGLDAWASVSTGDLQKQLTDLTDQQKAALSKVARISEGQVKSSAVTRLDAAAGTASVICFVEKQVGDTPQQLEQASPTRIQFTVDLIEQDGTWLVSTLTPVAVVTPEGEQAQ